MPECRMPKSIKNYLEEIPVNIKWKNFDTWQKEDRDNLYDCAERLCVVIKSVHTKKDDWFKRYKITANMGNTKFTVYTSRSEQDVAKTIWMLYAMGAVYMGDNCKLKTNYCGMRDYQILH